jgi:threonylcarbamoyladenosine tRNA methylthiotransferase MtaB
MRISTNIEEYNFEVNSPTVAIETHGCKLNQADSWELAVEFAEFGFRIVAQGELADVYLLNSCTVTHIADRKARNAIRSARRLNPSGIVIATGCYAQRSPDELNSLEEVDIVVGNSDKSGIVQQTVQLMGFSDLPQNLGNEGLEVGMFSGRSRLMVKIQHGCNQVCAYCIVPKVRGRERSIPPEELVRRVKQASKSGFKEAVLTGTQLGSYGFEIPGMDLTTLIDLILSETDIPRLRVSSLQPQEIDTRLLNLWSDNRLCPHFHLPLQSGSDKTLKMMRRKYDAGRYLEAVDLIRNNVNGASITADVIVGFPNEEDDDFDQTFYLCETIKFADIHVFPYSIRPGTSAAHNKSQVGNYVKRDRMNSLLSLAKIQSDNFREMSLGTTRSVLWEYKSKDDPHGLWTGLTDNYIRVTTNSDLCLDNSITAANLISLRDDKVICDVIQSNEHSG